MRLSSVLWSVGIVVIVVVCLFAADVDAKKGKKKDKEKKNKNKNKKKTVCKRSAAELKLFKVWCPKKSLISSISVVGHKDGTLCQGLTPDLLVQVNSCFWKNSCNLTYSTDALNYMLKLYRGNMSDCITQQPDRFVISYECTHPKKVKRRHVIRKKKQEGEKEEGDGETKDKQGIMVSHVDHPWLYQRQRFQESHVRERFILTRHKKKLKTFTYTIRTLNLMKGDNLTVKWTADKKDWNERAFSADHQLASANHRNHFVSNVTQVVFSLDIAHFTNGGEGFVICFKWVKQVKKGKRAPDVCKRLLQKEGCDKEDKDEEKTKEKGKSKKGGKKQ